jgi:hypothetical protein
MVATPVIVIPGSIRLVILALSATLMAAAAAPAAGRDATIQVRIDPRIELCSIIFRLAGFNEYSQGKVTSYLDDIEAHFGPHRDHAVIAMAQSLRAERGISFDACMALAIHFADDGSLQPAAPLDDQSLQLYGDGRWTPERAASFMTQVRDFAAATDFEAFCEAHRALYELTELRMRAMIDAHVDEGWFGRFYGVEPTAPFTVVPGLVNGGSNYGPKFIAPGRADGNEHLYAIIGVWRTDDAGEPAFGEEFVGTIIHEFNHSFVNHVVEAHRDELATAGELIQRAVAEPMKRQAYGHWKTIIDESVVRAAVVRYLRAHADEARVKQEIKAQEDRSFLWIAPLEQLLGEYEADRAAYPVFADFMPRVVTFFDEYAPGMEAVVAERERAMEAKRPQIVSIEPAAGSEQVGPGATAIVITFDRPMRGGYSLMISELGPFPPAGEPSWNDDRTVFTLPVTLAPDTVYAYAINSENGGSFRSAADDVPAKRQVVWFRTGKE